MAESTQSIVLADLQAAVARYLGYPTTSATRSTKQNVNVTASVDSGIRQVYFPPATQGVDIRHRWSFLFPTTTLVTVADTATVNLPDDFATPPGQFFWGSDILRPSIPVVSLERIRSLTQYDGDSDVPTMAAIEPIANTGVSGQRWRVRFYPTPDAIYTLTYRYEAYSGVLDSAHPYPLGGAKMSQLYIESCLAAAELGVNGDATGPHRLTYVSMLIAAIERDRGMGASYYGPMGQPPDLSECPPRRTRSGDITFNGDTW